MNPAARRRFQLKWFPPKSRGAWKIPGDPGRFDLFLLMGQSNMAGFGCVRADDPWQPGDFDPVPRVWCLGGQAKVDSERPRGRMVWRPATHPLHLNQSSCGFGLGLPFAEALIEVKSDRGVGLIPCAWGGAAIDSLHAGTPLFRNAVCRARLAAESGRLRGVLWHQGETDTRNEVAAASHADKLRRLMADLRREFRAPELPFVIGDLAEFTEDYRRRKSPEALAWHQTVRRGLREVADSDAHSAFVETGGLEGVDDVHFGRSSLIELGQRYAEAWVDMGA